MEGQISLAFFREIRFIVAVPATKQRNNCYMNLTPRRLFALVLTLLAAAASPNLPAQGTAFTYQGSLNNNGSPATGLYDLTFTLFDTNSAGNVIAGPLTNSLTPVTNGLFTVTLDFGSAPFNGNARWLQIGVRTNGGATFSTLSPRQELTPTPYAIYANTASNLSGTLPSAQLGGTYSNAVALNNGANAFDGTFSGQFFGSTFIGGNFVGDFVGSGSSLTDVWHTGGNFGTVPLLNFLGTTDNQPLIIKVNGVEAARFEPTSDTPNVVHGYGGNFVQPGLPGVTIGGGGTASGNQPNIVTNNGFYATIAGGYHNTVSNYGGAILGGSVNLAGGNFAVIGGGQFQTDLGDYAVIAGGNQNTVQAGSSGAFIGAGYGNVMQTNDYSAVIGGGVQNTIQHDSYEAGIASGYFNSIGVFDYESFIGGGYNNAIQLNASQSVIGGGWANVIQTNAYQSFVGGGYDNTVLTNADHAVIAGGWQNTIQVYAWESVISGGELNTIAPFAQWSVIGGGEFNTNSSAYSVIGGGYQNMVQTNAAESFIGGGLYNTIQANSYQSVIVGGANNTIQTNATYSFIGGGAGHTIGTNSGSSVIAGGFINSIGTNASRATVSGGNGNAIQNNSTGATIGGGIGNVIGTNSNVATIAGGNYNYVANFSGQAAIGGGLFNTNAGFASTIPGGYLNQASANYSFAAGQRAKAIHQGAFVWADSQNLDFSSTTFNQFSVRANGGVVFDTGGAGISLDGLPALVGGLNNANSASQSFTGGGTGNSILSGANDSTISGGFQNTIQSNALYCFIGGGYQNTILPSAEYATITAGASNTNGSFFATIGGGGGNNIGTNCTSATIGGGFTHTISNNTFDATIGGGSFHIIGSNSYYTTIGGGHVNWIQDNATASTIGGGWLNAVQAGAISSVIGGGSNNSVVPNSLFATIPGGDQNTATSYAFAAGNRAKASNQGAFVWADSQNADFASTANDQFLIRAQGNVGINRNNPASALDVNGTVTATGFSGNGSALGSVNAATLGGVSSSGFWKTTGNAGTTPGVNFIGTTDGQALLIRGGFVGVGRSSTITSAEFFGVEAPVGGTSFGGMYIDTTSASGRPFYGYSQAGGGGAYHYVDGADANKWKLNVGGDRITVTTGGNVGIGLTAPTFLLQLASDSAGKPNGGSWANTSDARVKKNIQPLTGALDKLEKLRGVTFEWRNPEDHANQTNQQGGFVAQEVEQAFPEWVREVPGAAHDKNLTPDGMIKSLSLPFEFDALVVEGFRQLRAEKDAQIDVLQKANAEVHKALSAQQETNARLEARLAALEKAFAGVVDKSTGAFAANGSPAGEE
jgi:hypothetical protein